MELSDKILVANPDFEIDAENLEYSGKTGFEVDDSALLSTFKKELGTARGLLAKARMLNDYSNSNLGSNFYGSAIALCEEAIREYHNVMFKVSIYLGLVGLNSGPEGIKSICADTLANYYELMGDSNLGLGKLEESKSNYEEAVRFYGKINREKADAIKNRMENLEQSLMKVA